MVQPHHQFAMVGCVCGGHCLTLHGAVHGSLLGLGHWFAGLAGLARFPGHGLWHGTALHGHFFQYGLGEVLAATRHMDADIPPVHGVSHVRHRRLVGVGLGAAGRFGWRFWIFSVLAQFDFVDLGLDTERQSTPRDGGIGRGRLGIVDLALGTHVDPGGGPST